MNNELKWFFYFLLKYDWWFRNYNYSAEFDEWMNTALDNPKFDLCELESYEVKLNGKTIWISNYPYAYGALKSPKFGILPRRRTVVRFQIEYTKWLLERKD